MRLVVGIAMVVVQEDVVIMMSQGLKTSCQAIMGRWIETLWWSRSRSSVEMGGSRVENGRARWLKE